MAGKKYSSVGSYWVEENKVNSKRYSVIDAMDEVNKALRNIDRLFENDRYGETKGFRSYHNYEGLKRTIEGYRESNYGLAVYSRDIHRLVTGKELEFYKEINKVNERLSMKDINEITVPNTLGIKETVKWVDENGVEQEYERVKLSINLQDIISGTDIKGLQEQLEEEKISNPNKWYNEEIGYQEIYELNTNTAFNHEAYATQFEKELSQLLDFLPIIGGIRGICEGTAGETMTGELLTKEQRVQSVCLGLFSLALDWWSLGVFAAGKKMGIKVIAQGLLVDAAQSLVFGYSGKFVMEKLTSSGFTPLQAFVINLFGTIVLVGMMKRLVRDVGGPSTDDIKRLDEIEIEFNHNQKHEYEEFMKQLKGQEDGLNGLTIQDYFNNKALFDEFGRDKSISSLIKKIRAKGLKDKVDELMLKGLDYDSATKEAKEWMKTQAVLHNPDQIVGGNSKNVSVLGNTNINSSIGRQWKLERADYLYDEIMKQIVDIPIDKFGEIYLNIKLTVSGVK